MSLFDQITAAVGDILSNPEQTKKLLGAAVDFLNRPEVGGVSGLAQKFQEQGLGEIVSSWIGTGQNLAVSAEQLQQVIGGDTLKSLADSTGLPIESIFAGLANSLPQLIDGLTPNGQLPEQADTLNLGLQEISQHLQS